MRYDPSACRVSVRAGHSLVHVTVWHPNWGSAACTLVVQTSPPALILRQSGDSRVFLELKPWDGISFGSPRPGSVTVTASSRPPLEAGQGLPRTLQATRLILIENDGEF